MAYNNSMGKRLCESKDEVVIYSHGNNTQKLKDKQMMKKIKDMKVNKTQGIIFVIFLFVLVLAIIFAVRKVTNQPKIELTDDTILTNLNVDKYAVEILAMYNREGQLELFKEEMERIQNDIAMYLIENMTIDTSMLNKILENIRSELNKDVWNNILKNKSTYYIGTYYIDENGSITFKFKSKSIEPSWINDESISKYIVLN